MYYSPQDYCQTDQLTTEIIDYSDQSVRVYQTVNHGFCLQNSGIKTLTFC